MADDKDDKKGATERSYSICKQFEVDLADSGAITALRDEFGKDSKIDVIVRVARVVKPTPAAAITALGQKKDLEGQFEVITDSAIKNFKVEVEVRRDVKIT